MRIIENGNFKILQSEIGYMLKDKNDNGQEQEDGSFTPPYLTKTIYLGVGIDTLQKAQELYEEVIESEE